MGRAGRRPVVAANEPPLSKAAAAVAHLANVGEAVHDKVAPKVDARKQQTIIDIFERFEQELAPHLAPFFQGIADNPDLPDSVRNLVAGLAAPTQLGQSVLLGVALGAVISPVLQAATAPFIQGIANVTWPANQVMPLSPDQVAVAMLKSVTTPFDLTAEAAKSGVDAARLDALFNIAGNAIGIEEAISLWRRNLIDETELARVVHYSNVRSDFLPDIKLLKNNAASVGEVITGRLKNHLDDTTAQIMFGEAGGRPLDYTWMLNSAGRPVSPEEMARLWRRAAGGEAGNNTTELDVDNAVAQSDINPQYTPFVKLASVYIPPVRSIMAILRSGAITDAQATALFRQNGVRDADIAAYIGEAHHSKTGAVKALSEAQTLRMYGAKFITAGEATVRLAALKYDQADIALLLGFADEAQHERYVNAVVTRIHSKFATWKLTAAEAQTALARDQIPGAAITDLINLWTIERDASVHVLTPASIVGAYRRKEISALDCHNRLLAVGVQLGDMAIVVADGYPPAKPDPAAVAAVVNA
jgi:hypothetical protein